MSQHIEHKVHSKKRSAKNEAEEDDVKVFCVRDGDKKEKALNPVFTGLTKSSSSQRNE